MSWVDLIIIAAIVLSAVISVWRGFTREAVSLAGWVAAIWIALVFADKLENLLGSLISIPSLRIITAFLILFFLTLIMASIIAFMTTQLVKRTGLSGLDRSVGVIFGLIRGVLIVAVLVLLGGLTPLPQDGWWRASFLLPHFQNIALWVAVFLPPGIAESIHY